MWRVSSRWRENGFEVFPGKQWEASPVCIENLFRFMHVAWSTVTFPWAVSKEKKEKKSYEETEWKENFKIQR